MSPANARFRRIGAWAFGLFAIPLSILPFYAYARYDGTGKILSLEVMRQFKGPALGTISSADAARYRKLHLSYRDGVMDGTTIDGPTPEATTIATKRFADDLRMLVAAGYQTVTPEQVAAWHAGRASLPANALLLTFDGGRMDTTLNAAPIVRRLHMRATVFMIGGAYRQAPVFYASPAQLRSLERAGWSIEAHAISGHGSVGIGNGHRLPYLSARRVSGGSLETLGAFTTRVARDYRDAKQSAEKVAGAPVIAFSWPFGAYGADQRTNDHATASINLGLARQSYALGFNDDGQETYALASRSGDPLRISRLRVDPTLTPQALFERVELAIAASGSIERQDA
jgi:peptidoglycan/xylan/chitin deacetylase (PgdA/CDA1 family)